MKSLFLLILMSLSVACVLKEVPEKNSEFIRINKLEDLVGEYLNEGESSEESQHIYYLSKVIWQNDSSLSHEKIDILSLKLRGDNGLEVLALNNNSIIKKQIFMQNKDFRIVDGKISIKRELEGINDNFVGLAYEKVVLGLDGKGDGKYQANTVFAGVALLIPIAVYGKTDVRFKRVN